MADLSSDWKWRRGIANAARWRPGAAKGRRSARVLPQSSAETFSTFPSFCLRHVSVAISIFVSVSVSNFGGGFGRVKLRLAASVE